MLQIYHEERHVMMVFFAKYHDCLRLFPYTGMFVSFFTAINSINVRPY